MFGTANDVYHVENKSVLNQAEESLDSSVAYAYEAG